MVVVPARPGPIVALSSLERGRSEIDEALDDLFGAPDDRGPGVADAVLVVGGIAAVVVGLVGRWPLLVVLGAGAAALGMILPLRSLWRRVASRRQAAVVQRVIGDGVLLRVDDATLERLVDAHRQVSTIGTLEETDQARAEAIAHAALREVATLLEGRAPSSVAEVEYVAARLAALEDLSRVLRDAPPLTGEAERRDALLEARREVEGLTGASSVAEATQLAAELSGRDAS
jgi:hypothetical protein